MWSGRARTDPRDHDFLCRCVEAAISAGARTINVPDTVGYAVPDEYAALITMLRNRVPNIDKAILSVHCHNDLGLAVANSLAAVAAGRVRSNARSTGWASAPATRRWRSRHGVAHAPRSHAVSYRRQDREHHAGVATGLGDHRFVVQPNKAIVGANAFAPNPESIRTAC